MKRVVLKLSGEALGGKKGEGIDPVVINSLAEEIKIAHDLNTYNIGIERLFTNNFLLFYFFQNCFVNFRIII